MGLGEYLGKLVTIFRNNESLKRKLLEESVGHISLPPPGTYFGFELPEVPFPGRLLVSQTEYCQFHSPRINPCKLVDSFNQSQFPRCNAYRARDVL